MAGKTFFSCKALPSFLCRNNLNPHFLHRKDSNTLANPSQNLVLPDLSKKIVIFNVEGALLKSSSLFPYFMLVAFEAGGLIRSLVLLTLYPFVCLVGKQVGLKIMVMVCFFGLKKKSFRVGRSVLPKFFLEDVGQEGFEVLMKCGRKVGVTDLPKVMVEGFLGEYLDVEFVGKELKEFCGYYVGLMDDKKKDSFSLEKIFGDEKMEFDVVGLGSINNSLDHQYFSICKEIYLVDEAEKRNWQTLPRDKYAKPLIFHDGRLAFMPTPLATLAMFIWIPCGLLLFIYRTLVGVLLPYILHSPLMAFSGMHLILSKPNTSPSTSHHNKEKPKGTLYVCNHRTLMDPPFISGAVNTPLTAVTYSLSRFSEIISPIRTVGLRRDREKDAKMMEKLLSQGDVVICPEGTTCREPYLLRFSPLFAEMSDEIVPAAIDVQVSMFYGTTASGFKSLDPIFLFMNPYLTYSIKLLEKRSVASMRRVGEKSSLEVANQVQREIGKALGFECTNLTRKDKYMVLAGRKG